MVDAIGVARLVEEQNSLQQKGGTPFRQQTTVVATRIDFSNLAGILGPPPASKSSQSHNNSQALVKWITPQEARERHEKGLCYYCDDKFQLGHCCQHPQMFMIKDFISNEISDGNEKQKKAS